MLQPFETMSQRCCNAMLREKIVVTNRTLTILSAYYHIRGAWFPQVVTKVTRDGVFFGGLSLLHSSIAENNLQHSVWPGIVKRVNVFAIYIFDA